MDRSGEKSSSSAPPPRLSTVRDVSYTITQNGDAERSIGPRSALVRPIKKRDTCPLFLDRQTRVIIEQDEMIPRVREPGGVSLAGLGSRAALERFLGTVSRELILSECGDERGLAAGFWHGGKTGREMFQASRPCGISQGSPNDP